MNRALWLLGVAGLIHVVCDRGQPSGTWAGTIDTLPGGAIAVSNPAVGLWDSASAWHLREDLRLGAVEGDSLSTFGRIMDVEVDRAGRIYVLDGQAQAIRVFDARGQFVRTIGRKGAGPGEFKDAIGMDWDEHQALWVADQGNARYSLFDTAGTFLRGYPRPLRILTFEWAGGVTRAGVVYDFAGVGLGKTQRDAAFQYDPTGVYADTTLLPEFSQPAFDIRAAGARAVIAVPFTPRYRRHLDPRGYIWVATQQYRILQLGLGGDTVRIVEKESDPVPVQDAERDSAVAFVENVISGYKADASVIPHTKPAYERFDVDERGYLWVSPSLPREAAGHVFQVFDSVGRFLGEVATPVTIPWYVPMVIRDDYVYFTTVDDLGVEYVTRLRIEGREGAHRAEPSSS
jgi:hypothetical protein